MKKPKTNTGGEVLLKKKGKKYFKELAKKRWAKHKEELKQWEKQKKPKKTSSTQIATE